MEWKYEEEYRLIDVNDSYRLESNQLRNVYIGCRADTKKERLLRDIVEKSYGNHVGYYVSRMSRFSSDVIHEPEREGDIENLMFALNEKNDEFSTFLEDRQWAMLYEELPK